MVVLTLQGNPSVMDVDRLKLEIQQTKTEDGGVMKTEKYSLRLRQCDRISLEVGREIIALLKLPPSHEWNELIINDCSCAGFLNNGFWVGGCYLWSLIDTIHKMNMFQSISYYQEEATSSPPATMKMKTKYAFGMSIGAPISIVRFQNHHSLQTLKLSVHKLGCRFAITLRKALQETTSLHELKIRSKTFNSNAALYELAKGIKANKSIRVLDLSDNRHISESAMSDLIFHSVYAHPTLEVLDLSRNSIVGVSVLLKGLGRTLANRDCKIAELRMNGLARSMGIDMKAFFDGIMQGNGSLKVLDLSDNRLVNHASISYILENVHKLQGLEQLILSRCTTVDVVRDILMETHHDKAIPKNMHLRHLDLSMATLREPSVDSMLCFCSHHFPMLESLNVAKNGLTVLNFPNYLSERNPPIAELTKLNLGFIQSWMLPGLSKIVSKLPKVINVGRGYSMLGYRRKNEMNEWHAIQFELDRRRFPVGGEEDILPLSLWPIIFQNVNEYFGHRNKRLIGFLLSIVHGPAMPLLRIALENQEREDLDM